MRAQDRRCPRGRGDNLWHGARAKLAPFPEDDAVLGKRLKRFEPHHPKAVVPASLRDAATMEDGGQVRGRGREWMPVALARLRRDVCV